VPRWHADLVPRRRAGRRGHRRATPAIIFSSDDTCDVGKEGRCRTADSYPTPNSFTGAFSWVEIDAPPLP
jgi:hypothetical protein